MAGLLGIADKRLASVRGSSSSAEDYARAAMRTIEEVGSVESMAVRQADIARQQLDALTQQVSVLIKIDESVLSVKDAIAALTAAQIQAGISPTTPQDTTDEDRKAKRREDLIARFTAMWGEDRAAKMAAYIPQFAAGGAHAGGLRLVGERGPELEATGPARIWNASDTRSLLSGGDGTSAEVRALREDLQAIGRALAKNTLETAKLMRRWDGDGMPEVRAIA